MLLYFAVSVLDIEFFGHGIFGTDGDTWKVQRKVSCDRGANGSDRRVERFRDLLCTAVDAPSFRPPSFPRFRQVASNIFNIRSFRDAYTPIFADDSRRLRGHLEAVAALSAKDPRVFVDIQDLLLRSTMDSFVKLATGYYLGNLDGTGKIDADGKYKLHDVPFATAFDKENVLCTMRASNPLWKITEYLDGTKQVSKWAQKTLNEFAFKVIKDKRSKLEKAGGSKPEGERSDLLDHFMATTHDDGTPLSEWVVLGGRGACTAVGIVDLPRPSLCASHSVELRDVVINMVLAGR